MTYLFLYSELADYTLACLRALKKTDPVNHIVVVHFPINPEAPFRFDFSGIGEFHELSGYTSFSALQKFVAGLNPAKIICSGWINKWYLRICLQRRNTSTCILTLDNHWSASIKQNMMRLAGYLFLARVFKYVWVPGTPQVEYADKLGFNRKRIVKGFYCCDVEKFVALGKSIEVQKTSDFPKRLLCVARYIPAKNYGLLWEAYTAWQQETPNDWELWCVGSGEGFDKRVLHPGIKHLGFIQQDQWLPIIKATGVFILPSKFEPWGVAVHEYAAAGFPMILSNKVGAVESFLEEGKNGWLIDPDDKKGLVSVFKQLAETPQADLIKKGEYSRTLAERHTPLDWASILRDL